MLNLLHMDFYRMKKSRYIYICLAILLAIEAVAFGIIYLIGTPEGQNIVVRLGMMERSELKEMGTVLEGVDFLRMFRQLNMNGGTYSLVFGITIALFVCIDFDGGFVKNIMSVHRKRWQYIGSKLIMAGIVDFWYIIFNFGFCVLLNLLFGTMVPFIGWTECIFYLVWVWFLTVAFAALVIMVCVFTRSKAAGVLTAVILGSGMVVVPVSAVMGLFHLGGWVKYTLYYNIASGPSSYSSVGDLKVFALGLVFLAAYSAMAAVFIRQDI